MEQGYVTVHYHQHLAKTAIKVKNISVVSSRTTSSEIMCIAISVLCIVESPPLLESTDKVNSSWIYFHALVFIGIYLHCWLWQHAQVHHENAYCNIGSPAIRFWKLASFLAFLVTKFLGWAKHTRGMVTTGCPSSLLYSN